FNRSTNASLELASYSPPLVAGILKMAIGACRLKNGRNRTRGRLIINRVPVKVKPNHNKKLCDKVGIGKAWFRKPYRK
ncbi:unnamed protein product, partial [Linum tenue]